MPSLTEWHRFVLEQGENNATRVKKPWVQTFLFVVFVLVYLVLVDDYVRKVRLLPEQYTKTALESFESAREASLPPVDEVGRKKIDVARAEVLSRAEATHRAKVRWSLLWVLLFSGALLFDVVVLARQWHGVKAKRTEQSVAVPSDG